MKSLFFGSLFIVISFLSACDSSKRELPFLGQKIVNAKGDTVNHSIPDFLFLNQDGDTLTQNFVKGKVYVADFFFTSCPTICPVMKTQMLRIYDKFKNNSIFRILSHTIDPGHDSVNVLKNFRANLGVTGSTWQFLRAEQEYTHNLAQKSYLVSALEDKEAVSEGGFVHSGAFVLVDQNRNIRGLYDGTKKDQVDNLIEAIELLVK